MSRELSSDSSEGPLAAYTHLGGVQGMMFESMNEQLRNYVAPAKFNECQNLQKLNCDDKRRFIDFGACEDVFKGKNPSADLQTKLDDKIDEVLLDIEKMGRALGRGSTKIAEEWAREAREDLLELERALKPEKCGPHAQSHGEHPGAKPANSVKPEPDVKPESDVKPEPYVKPESHVKPDYSENLESYENIDRSKPVEATVDQVLAQNDRSQNSVFPGENTDHFGWYGGRSLSGIDRPTTPESRFNYLMAWNMVYPEKGKQANPEARVEMQNFRTYVHTKDGQWLEILNQNESGIGGGLSPADFADMYAVYDAPIENSADGIASFKAPTPGFNFQPWIADRGHFDNQNIDGIYISGLVRSDRPDSNLVIDQGADWYEREGGSAVNVSDGVGTSNWLRISEDWQPLFYSNVSEEELRRNPPPGITS